MEDKKRKKAIYARKSKYTGKGESIDNQIYTCKHYLKTYFDLNITDNDIIIYKDEGYTGANTERPNFKKMMEAVKNNTIDTIICYRLDRISRNVLDFANLYDNWQEHNINFISVSERFDTTTPMGKAMLFIAITFAQLERDTIAERIRDNMYKLAKTGRWLGGNVPLGFISEKVEKLNINGKKTVLYKLTPINNEIEIIKTIFRKFLEFKSLTQVESYLIQNDYKTKRNCEFSRWSIKSILRNPVYAIADQDILNYFLNNGVEIYNEYNQFDGSHGIIGYCKTEKIKTGHIKYKNLQDWIIATGEHKCIISGKDWIEVQNLLKINSDKNYRKPIKNNAILVGILHCKYCKSLMRAKLRQNSTSNGDLRFDYICDLKMKSNGKKCACKNINGNNADNLIIKEIENLMQPTNEFYQAIQSISNNKNYNINKKADEISTLERNYTKNEVDIKNLINRISLIDNDILGDVQSKIRELKKKNEEIFVNIQKLKKLQITNQVISEQEITKIVFKIFNSYMNKFNELDIIRKRNFIKSLVNSMETDGENIYMSLFGSDNNTLITENQLIDDEIAYKQNELSAKHNFNIVLSSDNSK